MGYRQPDHKMTPPKPPPSKKPTAPSAKPGAPAKGAKPTTPAKVVKKTVPKKSSSFFSDDLILDEIIPNEESERMRYARVLNVISLKTLIMAGLVGFLIITSPIYHTIYLYYALNPKGQTTQLVAITMPNMTNRAVLSWATSSVTGILTIGFGDFEKKLLAQKSRFTEDGWKSFALAFDNQKTGKTFLEEQLVLTTVPSDTAVIIGQGINEQGIYQWKVQVPIIMTYATNDNVTRKSKAVVTLTIVRVWPEESPAGIAIKGWS
jgi:hypothetical protein